MVSLSPENVNRGTEGDVLKKLRNSTPRMPPQFYILLSTDYERAMMDVNGIRYMVSLCLEKVNDMCVLHGIAFLAGRA